MIADFEFLKNGETVYRNRQDLGFAPMGNPTGSMGFTLCTMFMEAAIKKGTLAKEAAEWDQVKIAGKIYNRPKDQSPVL